MTDTQIDDLFENPHFQKCMFDFISAKLQLSVEVDVSESRIKVGVELHGHRFDSHRYDYLIGDTYWCSLP